MIDPNTFGKDGIFVQIVCILNELPEDEQRHVKRTVRCLGDFLTKIKIANEKISDKEIFIDYTTLLRERVRKNVNESDLPTRIKTHLMCAIIAAHRRVVREK